MLKSLQRCLAPRSSVSNLSCLTLMAFLLWNLSFAPELAPTLGFFHSDKVRALSYAQHTRQLISCGGDGGIVVWNMDVERQEVSGWHRTREACSCLSALLLASVVIKRGIRHMMS